MKVTRDCLINLLYLLLLPEVQSCVGGGSGRRSGGRNNDGNNNNQGSQSNPSGKTSAVKNMLGDNINLNPDDSSGYDSKNGQANSPSDLQCSFESSCCWKNTKPPYDTMEYVKASGTPDPNKFQSNFGTSTTPTGTYLVVLSDKPTSTVDKAEYQSCALCASDNVQVSLRHWQSKGVTIQVCEISPSDPSTLLGCQTLPATGPGPDTVTLPAGQNINLAIVAQNFVASGGSMAIIDDITLQYTPCGGAQPAAVTPAPVAPVQPVAPVGPGPAPAANSGDCQKIMCNFDSGMCSYVPGTAPSSTGGAVKGFEIHQGQYGNLATGVPPGPDKSNYAGAYLKPKESAEMEVLISPFDQDRVIKFQEYKATQDITLRCCCDRTDNCQYDTGGAAKTTDYKQWFRGAIVCPKGTQKVIFYATNTGPNEGGVGVDNIQVYQNNGGDPNQASVPLC